MTKNELLTRIAATLTTLAETNGSPESMIYLAFGADIHEWNDLKAILLKMDWIKVSAHYVTLTEAGKLKAAEIESAMKKTQN